LEEKNYSLYTYWGERDASQRGGEMKLYWGSDSSLEILLTVIRLINEVLCYLESTCCGFCEAENHKMPVLRKEGNFGYLAPSH